MRCAAGTAAAAAGPEEEEADAADGPSESCHPPPWRPAVAGTACWPCICVCCGGADEGAGIGIGAAGFIDSDRNTIAHGTNLDWTGLRLADVVSEKVGLPVVVENDANSFGWAEARFGAARGKQNALIVAIGTGLGGAIVVNGQLLRGAVDDQGKPTKAALMVGIKLDLEAEIHLTARVRGDIAIGLY